MAAAILVTLACLTLPLIHRFELVAATQAVAAAAGAIFAPAVAAVTLGIVGPKAFARRTGRNEAFNHAGNAVAAAIAGISAYSFGPIVVFWLLAAMAVASIFATLSIPSGAIDDHVARGLDGLTARDVDASRQAVRLPGAADLQTTADLCSRDGGVSFFERGDAAAGRAEARVGASAPEIFGALFPLVVADLTRGTGHFNISQGAIATAAGFGGALSTAVAGLIIVRSGYSAAFLFLAAIAAIGLIGFCAMMPETLRRETDETTSRRAD